MFTPDQLEDLVIYRLQLSNDLALLLENKGAITRKDGRASGTTRDITVSTLTLTDGDVQLAILNVTIWVKDIEQKDGNMIRHVINRPIIDQFVRGVVNALNGQKGYFWEKGNLYVENMGTAFNNPETREHFQNIRVRVRAHN